MQGETSGMIEGQVTDMDGSALPGVVVTVTSPSLEGERTAVTEADGRYRILSIPPGQYKATFEMEGFKTLQETTDVRFGETSFLNATMQLATIDE